MKKVKIKKLKIENFKSIKKLEIDADYKNVFISGANGSGKTSVKEAWLWLFFGKDSFGKFLNPKPLDEENNRIIGLEPMVTVVINLNDEEIKLQKIQKEKWTKTNGSEEKHYTGLTNKFLINDVPKSATEFKNWVNDLIDEETFQILSDTSFFMSDKFHFKKRRDILINMLGVDDEDIIKNDDRFKELEELTKNKTIDELALQLKSEKKENNKNIKDKPIEINTLSDLIAEYESNLIGDEEEIKESIKVLDKEINQQKIVIESIKNYGNSTKILNDISIVKNKMSDLKNSFLSGKQLATRELEENLRMLNSEYNQLRLSIDNCNIEIDRKRQLIKDKESKRDKYLIEWQEENKKVFDENNKKCSYCGQELQQDKIEENKCHFNESKIKKLKEIEKKVASLKASKDDIALINEEIDTIEQSKKDHVDKFNKLINEKDELEKTLNDTSSSFGNVENSKEYVELSNQLSTLEKELNSDASKSDESIYKEKSILSDLENKKDDLKSQLLVFDNIKELNNKINVLRNESKLLKDISIELDRKINLVESFSKAKMNYIQEKVNNNFKMVKFKLFEQQENGGIKEICEPMYFNGKSLVGYNEGLNTGAKILSDIDIIDGISNSLGYQMPLFVDNAESVTSEIVANNQMFKLAVSKNKKLKVEVEK